MRRLASPFHLMLILFGGLFASVVYGAAGLGYIWIFNSQAQAQQFFAAYTRDFKTVISLGLILGTAVIIRISQNVIPQTIENAFTPDELVGTKYSTYKGHLHSLRKSLSFSGIFFAVGFVIFWQADFRLSGAGEVLMMLAACTQYALVVYVSRKLIKGGMMRHSLMEAQVTRNLFKKRELDDINSYFHLASTLTIILCTFT